MDQTRTTRTVRAGIDDDPTHGAVVPPLYLSTNYSFHGLGEARTFDYSRAGNPTRQVLTDALVALEGGAGGVVTASGMAAVTACVHAFAPIGATVVVPHDCYGGTWRLFDALARAGRFDLLLVDLSAPDAAARVAQAAPDLLWVETPSNPLLRLTDLRAVADAAHAHGAIVVADNTFCTPALQRPLELGADVVVHSTTKYLNGHSDVIGGAANARTAEHGDLLAWWGNTLGLTGGALDAYLTLRGLRTLHLRMRAHQDNAAALVDAVASHPAVTALHYPGLPTHPQHALANTQQSGFGAMVSLEVAGGEAGVAALVDSLTCFSLAESLGGVESLVCHPASMTHASVPPDLQAAAGITPGLVRFSVGIEDPADLIADLLAGLDRAAEVAGA